MEGFVKPGSYFPICIFPEYSKNLYIISLYVIAFLVAIAQASGGSSVLNPLCAKDQANENYEHRSGI